MAKRRRKKVEQNPLTRGQKVAIIGGIALAGGAAALFLTQPAAAAAPPAGPAADPLQSKAQECAALQAALAQLRSRPTPDAQEVRRLEQQVAACIAQARELGAPVDNATAQQSTGDQLYQELEAKFGEYKATDYIDWMKRRNIFSENIDRGTRLAAAYSAAVAAASDDSQIQAARLSIIRALDAAIQRRLCALQKESGCDRSGPAESDKESKAAQEKERVIDPLMAAHSAAIQKLGGPGSLRISAGLDRWIEALLGGARTTKKFVDDKFNEYKSVDGGLEVERRNNLRQEILGNGESLVATLDNALGEAKKYRYADGVRLVAATTLAALNASIDRHLCFVSGGSGCGTFGLNEDQPDVKARQEYDRVTRKLFDLYRKCVDALVDLGDASLFAPLVTAKMRLATSASDRATAKFNEYKATDPSDALKRNNLRQEVLANGALAAERLSDALTVAVNGANARPSTTTTLVRSAALLAPSARLAPVAFARPSGTSGLGQSASLSYLQTLSQTSPNWTQQASSAASQNLAKAAQDGRARAAIRSIASVASGIQAALDAAVTRKLCYQYDQPGCGRFAENEATNASKAADEQRRVIEPLLASSRIAAKFLADQGEANAEGPFAASVVRELTAAREYMDRQFGSLKATDYIDQLKRGNIRGDIVRAGQQAVAVLRSAKPATPAGKAALRVAAEQLLSQSRAREACYRSGASGCGRLDDAGDGSARVFVPGYAASPREDDNAKKADQEANEIGKPLAALIGDKAALAGLGNADGGVPTWVWWVAGVGVAAAVYASTRSARPVRSNRRPRRTSRSGPRSRIR